MRSLLLAVIAFALAAIGPQAAFGAPPANDNLAAAGSIGSLPFSEAFDLTESTAESGEPMCFGLSEPSVWYRYTPGSDQTLRVRMRGGLSPVYFVVYRAVGPGFAGLVQETGCGPNDVLVRARADQMYLIRAFRPPFGGATARLELEAVPPPANDDFEDAASVSSVPFRATVDSTAASTEPGEPGSCGFGPLSGTVWYAYTPADDGWVSASSFGPFSTSVAAYSGTSVGSLSQLGCVSSFGLLTLRVRAGETVHFQVGGSFGFGFGSSLSFSLAVAPNPIAAYGLNPGDPSIFDTVQFVDSSSDPGQVGIATREWDFGDGSISSETNPTNRYPSDGVYPVTLKVTTTDGRTAASSRIVEVKTHDVAITRFSAPSRGRIDRTQTLEVSVQNKRYPEQVQVQLLASGPGGFTDVGVLTLSVPVRAGRRTTDFSFSYTFTQNDAAAGKVTFQAVATIVGARDALPGDNTAIAPPTTVR